ISLHPQDRSSHECLSMAVQASVFPTTKIYFGSISILASGSCICSGYEGIEQHRLLSSTPPRVVPSCSRTSRFNPDPHTSHRTSVSCTSTSKTIRCGVLCWFVGSTKKCCLENQALVSRVRHRMNPCACSSYLPCVFRRMVR